jgi:hypothetical protein
VEEAVGEGVVGDEDIEAAVAVEVGEGDGHAFAAGGAPMPEDGEISSKVPLPLLRKRRLAVGAEDLGWQ